MSWAADGKLAVEYRLEVIDRYMDFPMGGILGCTSLDGAGKEIDTVEAGFMTKDLALLVGPDQKWLTTTGFLDKVDENLKKAMG